MSRHGAPERPAEALAAVLAVSCCGLMVLRPIPEPIAERDRQSDGRRAKSRRCTFAIARCRPSDAAQITLFCRASGWTRPLTAARLMAFAVGSRWPGLWGGRCQLVVVEGLLDAPRGQSADALVDRKRLPQVGGGFGGVAVLQVAVADSFQGACLFQGDAQVAGDGQGLDMVTAGLLGR